MITISAGAGRTIQRPASLYTTTGSILNDQSLQVSLGFSSSSSEAHVNGSAGVSAVQDGDTVSIVPRANTKG